MLSSFHSKHCRLTGTVLVSDVIATESFPVSRNAEARNVVSVKGRELAGHAPKRRTFPGVRTEVVPGRPLTIRFASSA